MPVRDSKDKVQGDAHLAALLEHAPIAIAFRDRHGAVMSLNRQAAEWTGLDAQEVIGKTYDEIDPALAEVNRAADQEVLTRGTVVRSVRAPTVVARRSGIEVIERVAFPLRDADGAIVGIGSLTFDVTQRARLERQLAQVSKMEAMGRLASQIAHDFNNVIGAIMGYAHFLVEELTEPSEARDLADRVLRASDSAKGLVSQLLQFARSSRSKPTLMDLRNGIEAAKLLVEPLVPRTITLAWQFGDEACWVFADPLQVQQIVMNLCVNGRDAIGGDRGAIVVTCGLLCSDGCTDAGIGGDPRRRGSESSLMLGQLDAQQRYAVMCVSDTGSGMDQTRLDQIFEPFFTTKPVGRGSGLGLGIVQSTIVGADGALTVTSELGKGTTFTVYWPLASVAMPEATSVAPPV